MKNLFVNSARTPARGVRSKAVRAGDAAPARTVAVEFYSTNALATNGRQKEGICTSSTTCSSTGKAYTTASNHTEAIPSSTRLRSPGSQSLIGSVVFFCFYYYFYIKTSALEYFAQIYDKVRQSLNTVLQQIIVYSITSKEPRGIITIHGRVRVKNPKVS